MPRNGSGIYIPPTGNPVASGTTISSGWGNTLFGDLGNEITNSLPRDGSAPLTGVLKLMDGSVSDPALTFSSETGTGFYRRGTNDIVLSVGGVARANFTATGINATNLGETTRGTAKVTTLDASGAATLSTLAVAGATTITGALTLSNGVTGVTKAMVGLGNADNTSDVNKPLSTAMQSALNAAIAAIYERAAPAGEISYFAMSNVPSDYLVANGTAVSRTTYARLFARIGTFYGAGDNSTTFNLPDLRGLFPRGWDAGRGIDPNRAFGNYQETANLWHAHGVSDPGHAHSAWTDGQGTHSHPVGDPGHSHGILGSGGDLATGGGGVPRAISANRDTNVAATGIWIGDAGNHGHNVGVGGAGTNIGIQGDGANESRPRNFSLLACIRY